MEIPAPENVVPINTPVDYLKKNILNLRYTPFTIMICPTTAGSWVARTAPSVEQRLLVRIQVTSGSGRRRRRWSAL